MTTPPSPVLSPPTLRRKSVGDRVDTERELSFTRPIFTEEDIQLIYRNSGDILTFHERFVDDLKQALAPLGSKFRFDTEDEFAYVDMPRHDTLELAIQIIVSMFVDRVSFRFQPFSLPSFLSSHDEILVIPSANLTSGAVFQALQILLFNTFRGRRVGTAREESIFG